jgi:hypothetical protein
MADITDDEVLELEDEQIVEDEGDEPEAEADSETDEGDELEIVFGDEEAAPASGERESSVIRELRAAIRERDKALAEARKATAPKVIDPGPKPTLESCGYDEEAFETALDEWKGAKAKAAEAEAEAEAVQRRAAEQWQADLNTYQAQKTALRVGDFEDSESAVLSAFSPAQQAVVVKASVNSAQMIYALGKRTERLEALSKIDDPIKLAAEIARLEGTMKVSSKRKAPEPDTPLRGNARVSETADKTLERLEREADKTGDRTKVIAYKRSLKAK